MHAYNKILIYVTVLLWIRKVRKLLEKLPYLFLKLEWKKVRFYDSFIEDCKNLKIFQGTVLNYDQIDVSETIAAAETEDYMSLIPFKTVKLWKVFDWIFEPSLWNCCCSNNWWLYDPFQSAKRTSWTNAIFRHVELD